MNVNAKQINSIDYHGRMDITTVLGFFGQIKDVITGYAALATALGDVWTAFLSTLTAYDDAYAQTRKWLQTEELDGLDKSRDTAIRGFMNALKAMQASPNATKAAAARRLQFTRDKYTVDTDDEYMKETTAVSQLVQDMEANCTEDLTVTGLDEWFADMKAKNEAFLVKMNERTEEQAGMQKGVVRDTRLQVEAAYRDLMKLLNAMAICEVPAGLDFNAPIDRLNAEIEHYRLILARKGYSSGSGSDSGNSGNNGNNGNNGTAPGTGGGTDPGTGGGTDPGTGGGTDPGTGGGSDPGTGGGSDPGTGGGSDPGTGGGSDPGTGGGGTSGGGGSDDLDDGMDG